MSLLDAGFLGFVAGVVSLTVVLILLELLFGGRR